jgi:hypothetical protein
LLYSIICNCSSKIKDKAIYIDYKLNKSVNEQGLPIDSTINYFPESIFIDTVPYYIPPSGNMIDSRYFNKEEYLKIYGGNIDDFRDTFKIEIDSFCFNETSYMLFKMREPVLSDRFLNKNIYRLIVLQSFNVPLVIRIEKQKNHVTILSKKLNRHISYPFFKLEDPLYFAPPEQTTHQDKEYNKQHNNAKKKQDSLKRMLNNTNYYLTLDHTKEISPAVWDSLESMIDSAKFWNTKPEIHVNYLQIDGSMWLLEGHLRQGYQIKRIPSPHFTPRHYPHIYDKDNCYAAIFRFLIDESKLINEYLY